MLAVGSHAHRGHNCAVSLEHAHLRAFGEGPRARAVSSTARKAARRPSIGSRVRPPIRMARNAYFL
eukprot:4573534-Pleurochrysis_carterae.AAC.3